MKNKMKIRKFNQEGHQKWRDYYSDVFTNIKSIAKGRISPKDIIKGYDKNLQKRYQILKSDSDNFSEELEKSKDFKIIKFKNSFELAKSLHESLDAYDFKEIDIAEVYDWIAMILFEQIFVPGKIQGCDINRYVCNRDFFYSFKDKQNKKKLNKELNKMRNLFFKSLTLRFNQKKGFKITKNSLTLKKPGKGIKYSQINKIVGKVLKNDKKSNSLLKWSEIE